jgi:hypothetical protein
LGLFLSDVDGVLLFDLDSISLEDFLGQDQLIFFNLEVDVPDQPQYFQRAGVYFLIEFLQQLGGRGVEGGQFFLQKAGDVAVADCSESIGRLK